MKKCVLVVCLCIYGLTVSTVFAFDGKRKGFILGGGLGFGYLSTNVSVQSESDSEGQGVFLTEFKIGYAPSNTLEIYYISKGSWWGAGDITFVMTISAIGVSKYLDSKEETGVFLTGGLGLAASDAPFEKDIDSSNGWGLFGGIGYEFANHWTIQADILYSHISEEVFDINITNDYIGIRATINVLAF
jgi:opacity protein-like surface antigen